MRFQMEETANANASSTANAVPSIFFSRGREATDFSRGRKAVDKGIRDDSREAFLRVADDARSSHPE
jgi:hypothetical protein